MLHSQIAKQNLGQISAGESVQSVVAPPLNVYLFPIRILLRPLPISRFAVCSNADARAFHTLQDGDSVSKRTNVCGFSGGVGEFGGGGDFGTH